AKNVKDANGNRDADVQNVVHAAISPNFAISHQVNDKLFLGFSGNSPFGMITKYDRDWVGSDHGVTSDVKTALFTPMAAYKATDKLSVGAGLQIQYVWAHLTNSTMNGAVKHVSANGNALDFGYQLGAMYEFTDSTRVGVGYRSEIKHKIKGDMDASYPHPLLNQDISVKLTTPAMLSFGVYHDINTRWAVMAEYQRVFWSSLKNLTFVGDQLNNGQYITRVEEKWRDTNFYAIGTSYMLDEQWKLRLGLAYDQSAVSVKHRTPRIPDTDRVWYSAGLSYQYNEHLSFNAAYTYMYAHKSHLDTALTGNAGRNVTADYTNSIKVFAFGLNYAF
ncbi:MAG: transporter, partial [Alphaproteobacteria bacterium]|nr:transporter [Alphaproteobacteria bacterium]